ncbi:MAG: transporter [Bacteroidetes bacterium]|nr:MAG: transporter [Bacteroidota bacterium]
MKTMRAFLCILLSGLPFLGKSQYSPSIASGRPGQSIGAGTVGARVFQIQSGGEPSWRQGGEKRFVWNNVVRVGLLERLEAGGQINYRREQPSHGGRLSGVGEVELGLRWNLFREGDLVPAIALQGRLLLPWGSPALRKSDSGSRFTLAVSKNLHPRTNLTFNGSLIFPGAGASPHTDYTLALSQTLSAQWTVFGEVFGNFVESEFNLDAGAAFLVHPHLQLDFSGGWIPGAKQIFLSLGFSWRWVEWRLHPQAGDPTS